jgi:alkaline phosphatase
MSKDAFSEMCKSMMRTRMVYTWDDMKRILIERMGLYDKIPVTAEEDAKFKELFQAMLENRAAADEESLYNSYNAFSVELFKHISSVSGIGWSTGDHSAAPVPVFVIGCGAEKFSGIQDNTEIPKKIMSIALGAE